MTRIARTFITLAVGAAAVLGTVAVATPASAADQQVRAAAPHYFKAKPSIALKSAAPSAGGVAISPDGTRAYVLTEGALAPDKLSTVSLTSHPAKVIDTDWASADGMDNSAIQVAPDGKTVYVLNDLGDLRVFAVTAHGVKQRSTHDLTELQPGVSSWTQMAISPDGQSLYIPYGEVAPVDHPIGPPLATDGLAVINLKTFTLRHFVAAIGHDPKTVAFSPDGTRLVVITDKGVQIVDVAHPSRVISVHGLGSVGSADDTVVSPDSRYAYSYSEATNRVTKVRLSDGRIVTTGPRLFDGKPGIVQGMVIAPDGSYIDIAFEPAQLYSPDDVELAMVRTTSLAAMTKVHGNSDIDIGGVAVSPAGPTASTVYLTSSDYVDDEAPVLRPFAQLSPKPRRVCHPFPDVTWTNSACNNIAWLKGKDITKPADGYYHPLAGVTRGSMTAFLFRLTHPGASSPTCTSKPFPDVSTGNVFCGYIQWAERHHVAVGYPDGTFGPNKMVTRGAMAAFLERIAADKPAPRCTHQPYSDVATGSTFCRVITWMKNHHITYGVGGGKYGTTLPVTRQAMASFLHRTWALMH